MEEQEYEIYDIITKQKIDKSQIKPGKSYIISYTKDKWKIRRVVFDEKGRIKSEHYIRLEDIQEATKETIIYILEAKGNTNIEIDYKKSINLEEVAGGIEIRLPIFNVRYKNSEGVTKERMLEAQTLKDVLALDENGNKHIIIKDAIIRNSPILIGNSKEDYKNKTEMNSQVKENSNPIIVNWNNVKMRGCDSFISKGNVIFNINENGNKATYDLRTNEGVEGLRGYMEKQKESEQNLNY